MQSIIKDNQ